MYGYIYQNGSQISAGKPQLVELTTGVNRPARAIPLIVVASANNNHSYLYNGVTGQYLRGTLFEADDEFHFDFCTLPDDQS